MNHYDEPFIMVYECAWQVMETPGEVTVYMALKRRVNVDNPCWYGTRPELAREAKMSTKTFDRNIDALVKKGLIEVTQRFAPKAKDWNGEPGFISDKRTPETPHQLGNSYEVMFHAEGCRGDCQRV